MNQEEVEKEIKQTMPLNEFGKVNNVFVSLDWLYNNGYVILSPKEIECLKDVKGVRMV